MLRHRRRRGLAAARTVAEHGLFFDATGEDRAGEGELWGYALTPERAEPSAGEREGRAPRKKEPSAGEREGPAPRTKEPSAGEREGRAPRKKEPLKEVVLPNGERGVRSEVLGLVAYVADRKPPSVPGRTWALTMRWHDPATGNDLPDHDQVHDRADAERDRADAAEHEALAQRDRADSAEHEVRAQRDRANAERDRADAQRDRADAAEREARAERAQAEVDRRRIAELEERLRRRDGP